MRIRKNIVDDIQVRSACMGWTDHYQSTNSEGVLENNPGWFIRRRRKPGVLKKIDLHPEGVEELLIKRRGIKDGGSTNCQELIRKEMTKKKNVEQINPEPAAPGVAKKVAVKEKLELTAEDVIILNSRIGLKYLIADKKTNVDKALRLAKYELQLRDLQAELIQLQNWTIREGKKIVVIFEGRDAAGKGGAIRRITAHINPRYYRIVALRKPTLEETGQWYFQRYVNQLPKEGEIVFFDRSWYNRAIVEPVNDFCTTAEYNMFMGQVNDFERMIVESGTYVVKIYLSITKEEQVSRFQDIKTSRLKRWKMTPVDERAQELWDVYTAYKKKMFLHTDTAIAPWTVIQADRKSEARIEVVELLLKTIPFERSESES